MCGIIRGNSVSRGLVMPAQKHTSANKVMYNSDFFIFVSQDWKIMANNVARLYGMFDEVIYSTIYLTTGRRLQNARSFEICFDCTMATISGEKQLINFSRNFKD